MRLKPRNPRNKDDVQISQSALTAYYDCPAKLKYMEEWKNLFPGDQLTDGIQAHAILAGEECPEASENAELYAESLWDLAKRKDITVHYQEVEQIIYLSDTIQYKRIIDVIGHQKIGREQVPVILDWKSNKDGSYRGFAAGGNRIITPKAMTFQAVSYLLPPSQQELDRLEMNCWPDRFLFVVAATNGRGEIYEYNPRPEDVDNFMLACEQVAWAIRNDVFPKVRGRNCGTPGYYPCDFLDMCYALPKWRGRYENIHDKDKEVEVEA